MIDKETTLSSAYNQDSSMLAKVLEYRLLADVGAELFKRGMTFDILRGDVDAHGHDVVIEALSIVRHCQLKTLVEGGKRQDVGINTRLGQKPSGCVIWTVYDPVTLIPVSYYWFGAGPGEPLPELGDRVGRHSKANSVGEKIARQMQRLVRRSAFEKLEGIGQLVDRLFGSEKGILDTVVKQHLRNALGVQWHVTLPSSARDVRDWKGSHQLAGMIDGYRVIEQAGLGDPFEWWANRRDQLLTNSGDHGLGTALVALFLLHRENRMSDIELSGFDLEQANALVRRLITTIKNIA
jgi:hypothetical protein